MSNDDIIVKFKELSDRLDAAIKHAPCPSCGHCPTCGHTPYRAVPVVPIWTHPVLPYRVTPYPWWAPYKPPVGFVPTTPTLATSPYTIRQTYHPTTPNGGGVWSMTVGTSS